MNEKIAASIFFFNLKMKKREPRDVDSTSSIFHFWLKSGLHQQCTEQFRLNIRITKVWQNFQVSWRKTIYIKSFIYAAAFIN